MTNNLIIRKGTSFLLILTLILSGFFITPNQSYAAKTILSDKTYYHLDMGVQLAYTGTDWSSRGYNYGEVITPTPTVSFNSDVEVIDAYPLSSSKGSNFDFDGNTCSTNIPKSLRNTASSYLNAYNIFYADYVATSMSAKGKPLANGNEITFSYSAKLNTSVKLDVVNYGAKSWDEQVWQLFGGKNNVSDSRIKLAIENALEQGRNGTAGDNRLYLIFCPTVMEYKKYIEIADLEATLGLPTSAKMGESFEVYDDSYLDDSITLETAIIDWDNNGVWETIGEFEGTGITGKNSGGRVKQTFNEGSTQKFRITVTTTNGQTDTDIKSINIVDGREISGKAVLEVDPQVTHETHPVDAEDWSTFKVDGESYSAKRAYEEGIAKNSYNTTGGTIKKDGYDAIVTYPKKGTYPITLTVNVSGTGAASTDTKNVEVLKTPYVYDTLGGFQKQNREQVLTFKIATAKDKPIVDYDITIKDLKSNELINLTKDSPQENGACIKTRTVEEEINNDYWTTLTVEFLTKYPRYDSTGNATQKFSYKIKVTDSKGDLDEAYKEFDVAPDKPPVPIISMQDSFLRAVGTNTANIQTSDASSSDGDQLQRTWSIANHSPLTGLATGQNNALATIPTGSFVNATVLSGYENLAFGTNQTIGFNKEGVGKTTVKLHVKDVWNEPTLEEYITASDYLEAETTASTQVINIAPVVSIEPLDTLKANIAILVSANKVEAVKNQVNTLNAALIEKGIDGNIQIVPVVSSNESNGANYVERTSIINRGAVGWGAGIYASDSNREYLVESVVSDYYNPQVKIVGYNSVGTVLWSFLVPKASLSAKLFTDSQEKYLIYSYNDAATPSNSYSYILDSQTGAFLKTAQGWGLSGKLFLSADGKRFYDVSQAGIKKYDSKAGVVSTIVSKEMWCPRLHEGKIGFVGKSADAQYYIGSFDMDTEKITAKQAPLLDYEINTLEEGMSWIQPVDWSIDGKVLVVRKLYEQYDGANGGEAWFLDTNTKKQGRIYQPVGDDKGWNCFMIKDSYGNCNYVGLTYSYSGTSMQYNEWYVYEYKNGNLSLIAGLGSGKGGSNYAADMGFYDLNQNKIYMLESGYYGKSASLDLATNTWGSGFSSPLGLDPIRGTIQQYNGRWVTYYNGAVNNGSTFSGFYYGVQYKTFITADEAVYNSLLRNAVFTTGEENYVFSMGLGSNFDRAKNFINEQGTEIIEMSEAALSGIADKIEEIGANADYLLNLVGNGVNNLASIYKNAELEPNTAYQYSYDLDVVSGCAVDVFKQNNNSIIEQGTTYYKEVIYKADLTNGGNSYVDNGFVKFEAGNFFNSGHYQSYSGYGGGGTGKNDGCVYGPTISFTLQKDGYIDIMYFRSWGNYDTNCTLLVDGKYVDGGSEPTLGHRLIFLSKGSHTISYHPNKAYNVASLFKAIEIGYLSTENNSNTTTAIVKANSEGTQTVTGTFTSGKVPAYTMEQSTQSYMYNIYDLLASGQITVSDCGAGYYLVSADGRDLIVYFTGRIGNSGKYTIKFTGSISAPPDKMMILYYGGCSQVLSPGETKYINFNQQFYDGPPYSRSTKVMGDMYALQIPVGTMNMTTTSAISFSKDAPCVKNHSFKEEGYFYKVDINANNMATISKCKTGYDNPLTTLSLTTANSGNILLNALISNFALKAKNNEQNITLKELEYKFNTEQALQKDNWIKYILGSGLAEMKVAELQKKDEDSPLVYKKGQLVAYNINYSDYEKDPSKCGYWLYAHTPYNDGEHPDGAIIYDEDGNIKSVCGQAISTGAITIDEALTIAKSKGLKILSEPNDRFYVDGKYAVYHWEYDNTSRGIEASGYPVYDKTSNMADLTFYIEGGASAPWITGISTSPAKVRENNYFSLNIGIDDVEKDVLNLTTEVYKDRKLIYTHRKKNILPIDAAGNSTTNAAIAVSYPVTNTGALPDKAQAGTYEAVATVRDQTGAGLGTYKFIVISEGKITGYVNHTDKWEENRKKYNVSWFDSEVNTAYSYAEYLSRPQPRKRGTNVFWSGEKFILKAAVAGSPTKVTCSISGTSYSATMNSTGTKNGEGETIYTGSLWNEDMVNKWGMKEPEQLTFTFTATYSGGTIKTHKATVIVDNMNPYWRLHRAF